MSQILQKAKMADHRASQSGKNVMEANEHCMNSRNNIDEGRKLIII